jgi:hypothetical protein
MLTNYHVAFESSRREVLFEVRQVNGDVTGFTYKTVGPNRRRSAVEQFELRDAPDARRGIAHPAQHGRQPLRLSGGAEITRRRTYPERQIHQRAF